MVTKHCLKMRMVLKVFIILLLFTYLNTGHAYSNSYEITGPGWFSMKAPPLSHEEAQAYYYSKHANIVALGPFISVYSATTITPEISELARGLLNDPKLIYDYVHNHIDYVPYFGSHKGATLTYVDGCGNDFDQASLMIALLRASGYTARYVYGTMTIPGNELANWIGVDQNSAVIGKVLASGGIPVTTYPDGTAILDRVWVRATINSTDYLFDPAFKTYEYTGKIDIGQSMGYDQGDLISTATSGSTVETDYVQNLNEINLRNKLATYSTALANVIQSQYPNNYVKEIISGRNIVPSYLTEYNTSLPFSPVGTDTWDDIPLEKTATLQVQHRGIDYTFSVPDLSGKRLSITYAGGDHHPELRLDGILIASGTGTNLGYPYDLILTVNHPYAANQGNYMDQIATYSLQSGGTYAIACGFGGTSETLIQKRQRQLSSYLVEGLPSTSEQVMGESLNIMGQNWLKELFLADNLLSVLTDTVFVNHHRIGLMAQEAGYYIDVRANLSSIISKHDIDGDEQAHFKVSTIIGSAFEHGILEQLMGLDDTSSVPGVSTIKLFQIANSGGRKVFLADSTNFDSIRPQLSGYDSTSLNNFQNLVNAGYSLILPDNGQLVLNSWRGNGYIAKQFTDSTMAAQAIISGGYFGGYSSNPNSVNPSTVNTNSGLSPQDTTPETPKAAEPVDMYLGSYIHDHTDLVLGRNTPLGLAFSRSYSSNLNLSKRTLGYGWRHNYDIYFNYNSHGDSGLCSRQPVDAASLITELYVSLDLMKNRDDIVGWMITSLANKWAVDQLINNAITVHMGDKAFKYIKRADGTWSPPPGITTQLIANGDSTFSLPGRFGSRIDFDTKRRISNFTDADNNTISFNYNLSDNTLSTIQDNFGHSLTLTYAGGRISSISDSAGRSVSYGYTSDNLTSYTDPELKVWGFGYDTDNNHLLTSLTNPLTITTVTNVYDTLDRMKTQTVPRKDGTGNVYNVTYNFYFSGFMNMEEDPDGNVITYYFDEKKRPVAEENALGHIWARDYDGQNHIVWTQDPKLNETIYEYDGQNNLTKIINALNYETNLVYDSQFRLTDIVDPLKHGVHYEYNALNQPVNPVLTEDGKEIKASYSYYSNGMIKTLTDGRDTIATYGYTYDPNGTPNTATSQVGTHPPINYSFDLIGRINDLTDQVSSSTDFGYDKRNLLKRITDPLTKVTDFTYDNAGRLWTKEDRNNDTSTRFYTPSSKLESITYPHDPTVSFVYNQLDNLETMQDGLGITHYTYYPDNSLESITDPQGFAVSFNYDETGNLKEIVYPGNKRVIYTYDRLNRLETVKIDWLNQTATYYYDPAGRLDLLENFNGTRTDYDYDNANRLTDILITKSDGVTVIASYHLIVDSNGNVTMTTQNEPIAPVLNNEVINYSYNDKKNRLMTAGSYNFTYDDEGQLDTGYGVSYSFDDEHRLGGIGSSPHFDYDGKGNRLKAVRSGTTTRYIYDAEGNVLAQADGSYNITRYYIQGLGLLAMVTSADNVYCYHFNSTGSTVALTDQSQVVVNTYAYDPFGNILDEVQAVSPQPFKFVGQYGVMAEPSGFYYMRARYYDPQVGRFVSEDPIGFAGGDVNLSAYVRNNPINWVDPKGLFTLWIRPYPIIPRPYYPIVPRPVPPPPVVRPVPLPPAPVPTPTPTPTPKPPGPIDPYPWFPKPEPHIEFPESDGHKT